ncbi:liprin-beta-2b [Eucyclogobius newberryi]|uniref:liprin-beta-2b n=1 Tax=Eucyclogobius newberryi TaxID=166745 RepID=UPI003B5CB8EB
MLPSVAMEMEASHMLEAALEQMDDIIAGSKTVTVASSGSLFELASPGGSGPLRVLRLAEDLKEALEIQSSPEERDGLRGQLPTQTAHTLLQWLTNGDVNICSPSNNETYLDRLLRLEEDKECLVLQVSVLTDQVEAQGDKIRDLESSLEEHRLKLTSTEEMLQQELMSRTSLETQKLDLMDEVSYLKLKLVSMDENTVNGTTTPTQESGNAKNNKAECVVNLISELQEQMCRFQEEISCRIQEKRALEEREAGQCPPHRGQSLSFSEPRTPKHSGAHGVHDLLQEMKNLKSKVDELEAEKSQYERRLRVTKLSISSSLHVCYQSLMSQLSGLKLTVEHTQLERQHWEERWRSAQAEISDLQQLVASKDAEIECLQTQLLARGGSTNDRADREEVYIKQLINKYHEYQRLKVGMETLLASNDEKDRRIEELTLLLTQYRKMREIMGLTLGSSEEELSCSPKLRAITHKAHSDIIRSEMSSRGSSPLMLSSSPYQRELENSFQNSLEVSLMSAGDTSLYNGSWPQRRLLSTSLEELQSGSFKKAIEFQPVETETEVVNEDAHMELNKYQTLPGKLSKKKERNMATEDDGEYMSPVQLSPVHTHDQSYTPIRCRSASAPVLGSPGKHDLYDVGRSDKMDECLLSDQSPLSSGVDSGQQSPVSPENRKTHRGIRKLWGKIRRSQSGSPVPVHNSDLGDFKRGGYRATAGPRLARPTNLRELRGPLSKWTAEQVCDWLEDIGLGQYSSSARNWGSNGQTLLSASSQEIEKELGIKNALHRKKLQLAIRSFSGKRQEKSSDLDYIWVTRWLDDIGLPQYKDQFNEARVDGHMLQYLTVNDLLFLKVTSQLHHLSIKCAIHVLHVNKFNPNCLKRRPSTESQCSEVVQWSNHRVMEWLRSVDLAEYAPNLRGSGVHGGLIMLEPRFSSDSLAMLLNIPPQKTLLRRHLNTNFNSLVGPQAQQEKREYTEAPSYTPLSITAKVKPKKLGFSNLAHLRRRRQEEATDYVCPVDSSSAQSLSNGTQVRPYSGFRGLSPILDRDDRPQDQMVPSQESMLEIETSENISIFTQGPGPETRTRTHKGGCPSLILYIRETSL